MSRGIALKTRTLAACLCIMGLVLVPLPAHANLPPQVPSPEAIAKLQQEMAGALTRVRSAQATLDKIVRDYEAAERRLQQARDGLEALKAPLAASQQHQAEAEAKLEAVKQQMNRRASSSYRLDSLQLLNVVLEAQSFRQFLTRLGLVRSVINSDSTLVSQTKTFKEDAVAARVKVEDQKAAQERLVGEVDRQSKAIAGNQQQVKQSLSAVGKEYEAVRADLDKRKAGFSFPVRAPYSYVDTYGAPRMEGTSFYHRHEGVDIFALEGTPVLATVDGVLEAVGNARLGGIKLWLRSPGDNWTYYYAHLTGYAPGIGDGVRVKKGDVLGYVGTTGNARGTPPHLHFEIHSPKDKPDWGPPVSPFPILRRIDPLVKK